MRRTRRAAEIVGAAALGLVGAAIVLAIVVLINSMVRGPLP